jgi:hypothetical protein
MSDCYFRGMVASSWLQSWRGHVGDLSRDDEKQAENVAARYEPLGPPMRRA